jgi:AraC-like DNA-binding protein
MVEKNDNFFTYLPITENNMRWDIYLTGVGSATVRIGDEYPPKGHPGVYNFRWESGRVLPEYQILLITEGRGTFESAKTDEIAINAGNIILLFPGIWHRYKPDNDSGWKEYWLSWNGEQLYRLMKKGVLDINRPILEVEDQDRVRIAFERILAHAQAQPAENTNVLSAYAMEVLTLAMDTVQANQVPKDTAVPAEYAYCVDDPLVFKALQIILNHSYRNFRVDDIVQLLPVSRRTLERKFLKTLNYPIRHEIARCRLERSKHLLINTTLPIKHIAFSVGFSSSDRMSKVFQREMGSTPSQYRKKFQVSQANNDINLRPH